MKDRQAGNVVHVRMRDDDIANRLALRVGQSDGDAACINGHAVVNQDSRSGAGRPSPGLGHQSCWVVVESSRVNSDENYLARPNIV